MSSWFDNLYERCSAGAALPLYESLRRRGTFRYRAEFEANQWKSPESIQSAQWQELAALLKHAYATTAFYRQAMDEAGVKPDAIHSPSDLARLPVLDKATVRARLADLVSSSFRREELIRSATGGSTGEPMQFFYDRDSYQRRVAAAMRGDGWAGWRLCAPEFYIWGAQLLPQARMLRWKKQVHHALLRRYVCSSFDLSAERISAIAAQYNRVRPRVVIGYANALYEFCRYARGAGIGLHAPLGVVSSAEKLYDYQRESIEEVFGAKVFDRYGCREVMMIGAECEMHSGLHVTADNVYVEVVRDGRLCQPGESGDILLTDLHNYGMPLIRYKVGDVGSWKEGVCACGRGLPLLNVVEGRTLGLITTPEGRVVAGEFFPHLMKDFSVIRAFQVIQETETLVRIRIALDGGLTTAQTSLLHSTVERALGPRMEIAWEAGQDVVIERERKFKPVTSRVPVRYDNTDSAIREAAGVN
jgi:phenylacetate-CoA ligase